MTVASALADAKDKMHKAILHLKEEMGSIRTGRASPALLSRITVDYYGATVPLLPGFRAQVDRFGNLIVTREGAGEPGGVPRSRRVAP